MRLLQRIFVMVLLVCGFVSIGYAKENVVHKTVSSVDVKGMVTIGKDKIISQIKMRPNQKYIEAVVSEDIKRIYELGYFENISVDVQKSKSGHVSVVFVVDEKPILQKVVFKGNRKIKSRRLRKLIDLEEGAFVDSFMLKEAKDIIWGFYVKKGYPEVAVDFKFDVDDKTNKAKITVKINEKGKMRIKRIEVDGNIVFSDRKIKKALKTKNRWLLAAGLFKQDLLEDDLERVRDLYKKKGFADVVVAVDVDKNEEVGLIFIKIMIDEGQRYLIGDLSLQGQDKLTEYELRRVMTLKKGQVYSEQMVGEEIGKMTEVYFNEGYIFTQIQPLSYVNPSNNLVDITFDVKESELIFVKMIDIQGNMRTKDKVVRRELRIHPGDKFAGDKIKKSKQNLENLGFFEDIRFEPQSSGSETEQDLIVDVKENKTGSFSFGGGYSSVDKFVGFIELRQRNFDWKNWPYFTGAGQDLSLSMQAGSAVSDFNLSFTEPWLNDKPVWLGFDLFARNHKRESGTGYDYEEERKGGRVRLGRRLSDELKVGSSYKFERIDISDVESTASQELLDEVGTTDLSVGSTFINYDTRDNVFVPTKGIATGIAFDVAGGPFGGDKDFLKVNSNYSTYHKLFKKAVVELKLRAGWAKPFDDTDELPIYERYFAGGASSVRGYRERKVGPIGDLDNEPLGGESMFVSNLELTQPLGSVLKAAVFFDAGNVWKHRDDFLGSGLYTSVGFGLRVKTPLGPISIDYGIPLDKEPGEEKKEGRIHFNMSRGF